MSFPHLFSQFIKVKLKDKIAIFMFLFLFAFLPATVFISMQHRDDRSQASEKKKPISLPISLPISNTFPATTTPSPRPPKNKIKWKTPYVSLDADSFYILTQGKKYYGRMVTSENLHSDPPDTPDTNYTSLEVIWRENDVEMRMFLYFYKDASSWWLSEARTYNGQQKGDWIYYNADHNKKLIEGTEEKYFSSLDLFSDPNQQYQGKIHFENISLRPFLDSALTPTVHSSLSPTTTADTGVLKLQLANPSQTIHKGDRFAVNILMNTHTIPVSSIDALIQFDPILFSIPTNQITYTDLFPFSSASLLLNMTNKLLVSSWVEAVSQAKKTNSDQIMATLYILAKEKGSTSLSLICNPTYQNDSNINRSSDSKDIIDCYQLQPLSIQIENKMVNISPTPTLTPILNSSNHKPVIANISLPAGQIGSYYNQLIRGYDNNSQNTLSIDLQGFPSGISPRVCYSYIENSFKIYDCRIMGIAKQSGTYPVEITVTDNDGGIASKSLNLTIN